MAKKSSGPRSTQAVKLGNVKTGKAGARRIGGYGGRIASGSRGGLADQALNASAKALGRSAPGTGLGSSASVGGAGGGSKTGGVTATTTSAGGATVGGSTPRPVIRPIPPINTGPVSTLSAPRTAPASTASRPAAQPIPAKRPPATRPATKPRPAAKPMTQAAKSKRITTIRATQKAGSEARNKVRVPVRRTTVTAIRAAQKAGSEGRNKVRSRRAPVAPKPVAKAPRRTAI